MNTILSAKKPAAGFLWGRGRRRAGYTLLEVAVATFVFGLLISMAFQTSMFSSRAASEKLTQSNIEVKGERTLKLIVEALTSSANLGVDTNGSGLTYYSPLDLDSNGTALKASDNTLEYGAVTAAGEGAGTMRFEFVPQRTISESIEKVDLNLDNDMNDTFDMGYVQRTSTLTGDVATIVGVTNIIQRAGSGHSNGDSVIDDSNPVSDTTGRIFYLPAGSRVLRINLWLVAISTDRFAHMIQCKSMVFLRNQ